MGSRCSTSSESRARVRHRCDCVHREDAVRHRPMAIGEGRTDVLQGTLDLMVLKTHAVMGPQHGYGIARRIEQISDDPLQLNEGTVYASLLRLRQRGLISASWGRSENNRRPRRSVCRRGPPDGPREVRRGHADQGIAPRPDGVSDARIDRPRRALRGARASGWALRSLLFEDHRRPALYRV